MGIPGLWERVASAADNRTLKQLAVSELKTEEIDSQWKVKLFKIGIDASAWMHSMCAVFQFNHAGAGKLPELRTLFFRLGILLKLPLHVVFVFDGLKHLPEKGHVVQNSPHWLTCNFQHMLELFGFQWTEAPGEAKAELATMNAHGVIDAAMTEDCNILIFGAPCIIRSAKKDKDYLNIEVYSEDGLEHAGGDYDEGVSGCGIKITHKVAQQSKIGQEMLHAFLSMAPEEFSERAKELVMELHSMLATDPYHFLGCRYSVPLKFPRREMISKYVDPITAFSATRSSTLAAWDALSCQPHLADLADFCRVQLGWDDDAIIERMYGGIWEGAYLHTLCKLPQHSDQAHARPTFKVISQSTIMALWCNIEVYNIKVDCQRLAHSTLGNTACSHLSAMFVHIPMVILSHMAPDAAHQYIRLVLCLIQEGGVPDSAPAMPLLPSAMDSPGLRDSAHSLLKPDAMVLTLDFHYMDAKNVKHFTLDE
ncbi:PIN domain-like protein [Suillus americanus]|nr:PIN domain-like protein [Suillus americanus]